MNFVNYLLIKNNFINIKPSHIRDAKNLNNKMIKCALQSGDYEVRLALLKFFAENQIETREFWLSILLDDKLRVVRAKTIEVLENAHLQINEQLEVKINNAAKENLKSLSDEKKSIENFSNSESSQQNSWFKRSDESRNNIGVGGFSSSIDSGMMDSF